MVIANSHDDYGFFGFTVEPYCSSTASYCSNYASVVNDNFLSFINTTSSYLFMPENRFNVNTSTFFNNLVQAQLNINHLYMKNTSALEETLYVDQVSILDDTANWFARK